MSEKTKINSTKDGIEIDNVSKKTLLKTDGTLTPEEKEAIKNIAAENIELLKSKELIKEETKVAIDKFIESDFGKEYSSLGEEKIKLLQEKLKITPVDGRFTKELFFAVIDFQKTNKQSPTGIADENLFNSFKPQEISNNTTEVTTESIVAKDEVIMNIITKYSKYKSGEWKNINAEIASLFGITLKSNAELISFGKKFQKAIDSKENDGKIGPKTMNHFSKDGDISNDNTGVSTGEPVVTSAKKNPRAESLPKNKSKINSPSHSKKIESLITSIDNEINSTKNYIESSKKEVQNSNMFEWTERMAKKGLSLGGINKTSLQERIEDTTYNSVNLLFKLSGKLRGEILGLQKSGGSQAKIEAYENKYNELVAEIKKINHGKNIPGLDLLQASKNTIKETGQNLINGKSIIALKNIGEGTMEGLLEGLKSMLDPRTYWAILKGLGMAIGTGLAMAVEGEITVKQTKAMFEKASNKIAKMGAEFAELPPDKMGKTVGKMMGELLGMAAGGAIAAKGAKIAFESERAFATAFESTKGLKAGIQEGRVAANEAFKAGMKREGKNALNQLKKSSKEAYGYGTKPVDTFKANRHAAKLEGIEAELKVVTAKKEHAISKLDELTKAGLEGNEKNITRLQKEIHGYEEKITGLNTKTLKLESNKAESMLKKESKERLKSGKKIQNEIDKLDKEISKITPKKEKIDRIGGDSGYDYLTRAEGAQKGFKGAYDKISEFRFKRLAKQSDKYQKQLDKLNSAKQELVSELDKLKALNPELKGTKAIREEIKHKKVEILSTKGTNIDLVNEQRLEEELLALNKELKAAKAHEGIQGLFKKDLKDLAPDVKEFFTQEINALPNKDSIISAIITTPKDKLAKTLEFIKAGDMTTKGLDSILGTYNKLKNTKININTPEMIRNTLNGMKEFVSSSAFMKLGIEMQKAIKEAFARIYSELKEMQNNMFNKDLKREFRNAVHSDEEINNLLKKRMSIEGGKEVKGITRDAKKSINADLKEIDLKIKARKDVLKIEVNEKINQNQLTTSASNDEYVTIENSKINIEGDMPPNKQQEVLEHLENSIGTTGNVVQKLAA